MRSLRAQPGQKIATETVRQRSKILSQILKFEFIFRVGMDHDSAFNETIALAHQYGTLEISDEGICFLDSQEAKRTGDFAANLFSNFIDAYWCVGRNLRSAISTTSTRNALVLKLLDLLRADFLSGNVICPEARSKSTIDNAVRFFQDRGILTQRTDRTGFQLNEPVDQKGLNDYLAVLESARINSAEPLIG
jgi:glycerol-3-phosphate O-acyltransferase